MKTTRRLPSLALMCLALLPLVVSADEKVTATKIPVASLADAKDGDWAAYSFTISSKLGKFDSKTSSTILWQLAEVKADSAKLLIEGRTKSGESSKHERLLKRGAAATVENLLGLERADAERPLSQVKVSEAALALGEKSLSCKKLRCKKGDPSFPEKDTDLEIWFSAKVRCGGVAQQLEQQTMTRGKTSIETTIRLELIGYGRKDQVEWGRRPW